MRNAQVFPNFTNLDDALSALITEWNDAAEEQLCAFARELKSRLASMLDYPLNDLERDELKSSLEQLRRETQPGTPADHVDTSGVGALVARYEQLEEEFWADAD